MNAGENRPDSPPSRPLVLIVGVVAAVWFALGMFTGYLLFG